MMFTQSPLLRGAQATPTKMFTQSPLLRPPPIIHTGARSASVFGAAAPSLPTTGTTSVFAPPAILPLVAMHDYAPTFFDDAARQALAGMSLTLLDTPFPVQDDLVYPEQEENEEEAAMEIGGAMEKGQARGQQHGGAAAAARPLATRRIVTARRRLLPTEPAPPRGITRQSLLGMERTKQESMTAERARVVRAFTAAYDAMVRSMNMSGAHAHENEQQRGAQPAGLGVWTTAPPLPLRAYDLRPGGHNAIFDVSVELGHGVEGTAYGVRLHPNGSLHYIVTALPSATTTASARWLSPLMAPPPGTVAAVMKKTAIYEPSLWLRYQSMLAALVFVDSNGRAAALIEAGFNPSLIDMMASHVDTMWMVAPQNRAELEREAAATRAVLQEQFDDPSNPAYVDALGAFLTGRLALDAPSPFFTLFYGSARAHDAAFFPPDDTPNSVYERFGPAVNRDLPVQLTFTQPLDATVSSLAGDPARRTHGWFETLDAVGRRVLHPERTMAFFGQVVFGLALAQARIALVNNDLNLDNLLYETVPESTMLYYRDPRTERYYAVPSLGRVYKMIDFGRATFGPPYVGSAEAKTIYSRWLLRDMGNDLYKVAFEFLLWQTDAAERNRILGTAVPVDDTAMGRMFRALLSCDPQDERVTAFSQIAACEADPNLISGFRRAFGAFAAVDLAKGDLPEFANEDCALYGRFFWPYGEPVPSASSRPDTRGPRPSTARPFSFALGGCVKRSVPADNIHWFDSYFVVDRADVPHDAIVSPIF